MLNIENKGYMNLITNIDISILNFIRENLTNPCLDRLMTIITKLGDGGFIWILITAFLLFSKNYRTLGKILVLSMLINAVVVNLCLKPIFARTRPFDLFEEIHLIIGKPQDYSFPSGHTSVAFAFASVIIFYSKSKIFKSFSLLMSILMGYSRLYLYVHYPTDVIFGALIGILCSLVAKKIFEKGYLKKYFNKKIE